MQVIIGIDLTDASRKKYILELEKQNPYLLYSIKLLDECIIDYIKKSSVSGIIDYNIIYEKIRDRINEVKKTNKAIIIIDNNLNDYVRTIMEDKYCITDLYDYYISAEDKVDANTINQTIKNEMKKKVLSLDEKRFVFGIGGLSESGKSSTGRILLQKFCIPNFKFNYINDVVKKAYGLREEEDLFANNSEFLSILVIDEIVHLMNRMYYWNIISIESLHSFTSVKAMKETLKNNFIVIYLKTDNSLRTVRNALNFNNDIEKSKKAIEEKDNIKKARGADEIEKIANFVVENNGDIVELENKLYNIIKLVKGGVLKMRNRAGGMLIENGKLLLMHRIKNVDGETREYYVVPGGGIEEGETLEEATKRELKEEIGIDIKLLSEDPLLSLSEEKGTQYFTLIERISGEIGTGKGPEFSDPKYADRGFYGPEMVAIKDIIDGKIKMVPDAIKEGFINIVSNLGIENLNSKDLVTDDGKVLTKNK